MRAIKFRGKSIEGKRLGEWIHGAYLPDFDGYTHRTLIVDCITGFSEEVNPITIGQFTGLLDKNGKEIYEGDILQNTPKEVRYKVYWSTNIHSWSLEHTNNGSKKPLCCLDDKFEVIGSIYDNPELINK